jgi:hypothetical protein
MGPSGFHGDTFTSGFGDFSTMKKSELNSEINNNDMYSPEASKMKLERDSTNIHGDAHPNNFRNSWTIEGNSEKSREADARGRLEHKRRPEMDSSGFHGDTFKGGFGDFWTMKKKVPEMDSSGFHGDTFHGDFGNFWTMKKRSNFRNNYMNGHNGQPCSNCNNSVNMQSPKSH